MIKKQKSWEKIGETKDEFIYKVTTFADEGEFYDHTKVPKCFIHNQELIRVLEEVEKVIKEYFRKMAKDCFPDGSVDNKIIGNTHYYQKYGNELLEKIDQLKTK